MALTRPFFYYHGGKWRDAVKNYPAPRYDTIIEPFAGAAGYSCRYADRRIIIADKSPVIAGLWQYLIRVTPGEILALPDLPEGATVDDLHVPQEARWLIGFWLNAGAELPCKRPSAWMRAGRRPNGYWGSAVRQHIAAQLHAIRHWQALNLSYDDFPARPPATWFIDPPYQKTGLRARYSCTARHIDYAALGDWTQALPGQVIACEAAGASWLPFKPLASVNACNSKHRSREALWTAP